MRGLTFLASGLIGLAAAAPAPQDIDFDLAYALPDPTSSVQPDVTAQTVSYTASAIYQAALSQITATTTTDDAALDKRAASSCYPLPTGYGDIPSPDSPSAFQALPTFAAQANTAQTPSGYTLAFQNLNASNNAYGYLGYTTLKSYDVATCASKCNGISGCVAFNIYFERDPSLEPGSGSQCANPASLTQIKCAWWGGPVTAANALNYGQYRNQFQVVIAGSNGYVSNSIASVPGYTLVGTLGNAAINAPYDQYGYDSFMGSAIFTSGPFNAQLCAKACSEKSAYALAHPPTDGSPVQTCQFFNTYILYINSTSNPANNQGQYCAMYSESWPKSYATNTGQYRGSDKFMIQYSFSFSNSTSAGSAQPLPAVYQASRDISYATLQPFCSSYMGFSAPLTTTVTTSITTPVTFTTVTGPPTSTVTILARRDDSDIDLDLLRDPSVTAVAKRDDSDIDLDLLRDPSVTALAKRALSTPAVLTKYPTAILSSACNMAATSAPASTIVSTVYSTAPTVTSTTIVASVAPTVCAKAAPTNFKVQVVAPGTIYDGAYLFNPPTNGYYVGLGSTSQFASKYDSLAGSTDLMFTLGSDGTLGLSNPGAASGLQARFQGANGGRISIYSPSSGKPMNCAVDLNTQLLSCTSTMFDGTVATDFYLSYNGYVQLNFATSSYNPSPPPSIGFIKVQLRMAC